MSQLNRLDLEVTRRCKYKCGVCSVSACNEKVDNEISLEELKTKVKEFHELGGQEISITGGEPTERGINFLTSIIQFAKNLELKTRMYCVGYGLQNNSDVHALKVAGLDNIIITLAGRKNIDEIYKGVKGSFEVAIRTIELCRKNDIDVTIHFTPTKLNFEELPYVIDVAHDLGVEKIRIMSFIPQGRGWTNRKIFQMNKKDEQKFERIVELMKVENKINLQFSGPFEFEAGEQNCLMAKNRIVVTSDGIIIPTFAVRMNKNANLPSDVFNLGNIKDSKIQDAWFSPLLSASRKQNKCDHCPSCLE